MEKIEVRITQKDLIGVARTGGQVHRMVICKLAEAGIPLRAGSSSITAESGNLWREDDGESGDMVFHWRPESAA